ncbi:MAG: lysophospholipid acyltransferase family protein [Candidatus Limnocylindrus sp.]
MAERIPLGMRLSERFGRWAMQRLAGEIVVDGLNRVPTSGPVLLTSNHISWVDPVLLACWLTPATGRPMAWMGKAEAMRWPLIGWFLRVNGVCGVRRGGADLEAFRLAERVLGEGRILGIYPEGTRSPDGILRPFRDGAALLALRSGAPVLPVAVTGTDGLWRKGSLIPRRVPRVTLTIGEPVVIPRGEGSRPELSAVSGAIHDAVAALLPKANRP